MTDAEIEAQVRAAYGEELALIDTDGLRERVVRTWVRAMQLAGSTDLRADLPSHGKLHDRERPGWGVDHMRAVTHLAHQIAGTLTALHRAPIDRDTVVAGALLHDVGKLLENVSPERTPLAGPLLRHAFTGVHLAAEQGLPGPVLHIIAYHAFEGQRVHRTHECEIVYRADFLSLDAVLRREIGKGASEVYPYVYLP